jgi:hypothetical protein
MTVGGRADHLAVSRREPAGKSPARAGGGHPNTGQSRSAGSSSSRNIMFDTPDGHASEAARQADAVEDVERNTFDDRGLDFVHQEKTSDGSVSRFNRFVRRDA